MEIAKINILKRMCHKFQEKERQDSYFQQRCRKDKKQQMGILETKKYEITEIKNLIDEFNSRLD